MRPELNATVVLVTVAESPWALRRLPSGLTTRVTPGLEHELRAVFICS